MQGCMLDTDQTYYKFDRSICIIYRLLKVCAAQGNCVYWGFYALFRHSALRICFKLNVNDLQANRLFNSFAV